MATQSHDRLTDPELGHQFSQHVKEVVFPEVNATLLFVSSTKAKVSVDTEAFGFDLVWFQSDIMHTPDIVMTSLHRNDEGNLVMTFERQ